MQANNSNGVCLIIGAGDGLGGANVRFGLVETTARPRPCEDAE
ncbi:MAG TPA: hypothetical protein VIY68_14235 [Steroidobacteraceae bacterium]